MFDFFFLDTWVKMEDNVLYTDLFVKPTCISTTAPATPNTASLEGHTANSLESSAYAQDSLTSKPMPFPSSTTTRKGVTHYPSSRKNWIMSYQRTDIHSYTPQHHSLPHPRLNKICSVWSPILDILKDNRNILECTPTLKCISEKTTKIGFRRNPNLRPSGPL